MTVAGCIVMLCMAVSVGVDTSTRFLPPPVPTAPLIFAVDMSSAGSEDKLTASTLQGLVNRQGKAELYLLLGEGDAFWLSILKSEKFVEGYANISLEEALRSYSRFIKTVIVYDPDLPASINAATMMAAVDGGVVVAPERQREGWGAAATTVDLRGRWKTNAEVFRWTIDNLLPKMNPRVLACYHPTACNHHLRDYLVQQKVFHFWVSGKKSDDACKGDYEAERALAEEVLKKTPPNVPVLGFWYSGVDRGLDEYDGVGLAGEYGKITVVSDWASNLSILGGMPVNVDAAVAGYAAQSEAAPTLVQTDKVYLCIDIVESGDAPSYVQGRMYKVWQDQRRGDVPINWSLGPAILDLAPPIAWYFYKNARPLDYLYMSISGAGYCHPYRRMFSQTVDPEGAWGDYVKITRSYLDRMKTGAVGLYTDAWQPFSREAGDVVTLRFAAGLPGLDACILGMGRDEGISPEAGNYWLGEGNAPLVSHIMTRWDPGYAEHTSDENIEWLVNDIRARTPAARPCFMHVMALSWAYGPSEIYETVTRLGETYIPLTIPQYISLYRQHSRP